MLHHRFLILTVFIEKICVNSFINSPSNSWIFHVDTSGFSTDHPAVMSALERRDLEVDFLIELARIM
jgi:hypothetical protein